MNLSQIASWILMLSIFGIVAFGAYSEWQPLPTRCEIDLSSVATGADLNNSLSVAQSNILGAIAASSYWANCVPVDMNYVSGGQNQVAHAWNLYCPLTTLEIEKLKEAGK